MNAPAKKEATFHLRDYLSPGGRYPYDRLPRDMQSALASGAFVTLLTVAGFPMVFGWPDLAAEKRYAWSVADTFRKTWHATAIEAIRGINGSRSPRKLGKVRT